MDECLRILKALSDQNRLRIVAALMNHEELCACQITALLQVTGATVSRHLGQLVNAGILKNRKDGRWIYYRLHKSNNIILPVIGWIQKKLADDTILTDDRAAIEKIIAEDKEDLCRRQRGESCCPLKKSES